MPPPEKTGERIIFRASSWYSPKNHRSEFKHHHSTPQETCINWENMMKRYLSSTNLMAFTVGSLVLVGLYLTSLYSYLLFHTLVEVVTILIAGGIFILAWNTRRINDNSYLLFIGIAYVFVAFIDLIHTLAYKGMSVFQGYDANLPTQLWIAARYMQGISLLIASFFIHRKPKSTFVLAGFGSVTILLLMSIFYWQVFPVCYIEGTGLTPFKKISEYVISLIILAAIALLLRDRKAFERRVLLWLVISFLLTIGAELAFVSYVSVYDYSNLIGHLIKLIAFYYIYRALIETGLSRPYDLIFRDLAQSKIPLQQAYDELRKTKEEAEENQNILNLFLQYSPILMYLKDEKMRVLRASKNLETMLGIPVEQMLGKTNAELWPSAFAKKIETDLMTLKNDKTIEVEEELKGRFYTTIKFPIQMEGEPRYIAGFSIDITKRKQAEEALRESEEKYRTVADFTNDWEAWSAPDGTYLYVSPSCERITGYTAAEFLADPNLVMKITHPDDLPMVNKHFGTSFDGSRNEDLHLDFRVITPNGEIRWVNHLCTAVYGVNGKWLGRRESNRDTTERKQAEDELRHTKEVLTTVNIELQAALNREKDLARTDVLTGINNRRHLFELAEREFDVATRYQQPLSVLIFDLDHFKQVNDTFGHAVGDQMLQRVTEVACAELRSVDVIGRYGGEEFVILLPMTTTQDALPLAERIRAGVAAIRVLTEKRDASVTLSIGIAETKHTSGESLDSILIRADKAMYAAKKAGRNCTVISEQ